MRILDILVFKGVKLNSCSVIRVQALFGDLLTLVIASVLARGAIVLCLVWVGTFFVS